MRLVLLVILLIIFATLVYFSVQELMNPPFPLTQVPNVKEPFQVAPTRASECRCLPGYIPSKVKGGSKMSGEVFTDASPTFWYFFVPSGTKNLYRIQEGDNCGIPHIYTDTALANQNKGNYPKLPRDSGFINSGILNCEILNNKKTVELNYFCQNLDDSQKTKACY